ncbi:hypothetical protein [Psychrobacillus sp. FJAT-21963]|uniref:hypothetical protein n=1 Tax=Psychrobacillus sp. FJAT-21963 TaxID=1712028 RepID=UPI0006FFF6FE|nr:hypothetical protein [Psychrobacillus sp. FJAT-21963]KQL33691.1 hypothetical protein AN959_16325 [Psychrobacillus sp. FJAT-21963]
MNYRLYFAVPTFTFDENDSFPMTDNYVYWIPLMEYFLKGSDTIEIHSWYDEKHVIEEIIYLSNLTEIPTEHKLTCYKGKLNPIIVEHILRNNVTTNGRLKWFSIFLSKEGQSIFSSEHWGTEFFAHAVNKNDISFIKSIMPNDTNFHIQ